MRSLLLSGLAFNPLALAHFFPRHPLGTEGIIVLQIALLFGGGWLVWRCPRMPLIPIVFVVLAFGAVAILGGYGTVRSLQKVQERNRLLATIDRSEAVQQHLSGRGTAASRLGDVPRPTARRAGSSVFCRCGWCCGRGADGGGDRDRPGIGRLSVNAGGLHLPSRSTAQTYNCGIRSWLRYIFSTMRPFTLRPGIFIDVEESIYQARVRFDASAQTQDGERAQVRAWLVLEWQQEEDANWRIRRWETESLEMLTREHALFAEVLDEALPRDEDRARARFSRHAELVRQSFSDSAFVAPHRYFTRQAFDRHPGISVVDIDADGYDDLYIAVPPG